MTLIVTLSGVLIRGNGSEIDALDLEREVINLKYVICFTIQNIDGGSSNQECSIGS